MVSLPRAKMLQEDSSYMVSNKLKHDRLLFPIKTLLLLSILNIHVIFISCYTSFFSIFKICFLMAIVNVYFAPIFIAGGTPNPNRIFMCTFLASGQKYASQLSHG